MATLFIAISVKVLFLFFTGFIIVLAGGRYLGGIIVLQFFMDYEEGKRRRRTVYSAMIFSLLLGLVFCIPAIYNQIPKDSVEKLLSPAGSIALWLGIVIYLLGSIFGVLLVKKSSNSSLKDFLLL